MYISVGVCDSSYLSVNFCFILLGGFEVNFMDDVGQTLLNWASAFGTLEMVRNGSSILSSSDFNTKKNFISCFTFLYKFPW